MKDAQSIVKIRFLVTFFTFLSVIRQNFEYNLRNLANFRIKTQTSMISPVLFQKTTVFFGDFLKKIILFTLKIYLFTMKHAQSNVKISFLVTCLHF